MFCTLLVSLVDWLTKLANASIIQRIRIQAKSGVNVQVGEHRDHRARMR